MLSPASLAIIAHFSTQVLKLLVKLVEGVPSNIIVFGRLFTAGIVSIGYLVYNYHELFKIQPRLYFLYLVRAIMRYCGILCTYYGYQRLSMQTIAAIGFTEPFFTVVLAMIFLKEKIPYSRILWLILGSIGAYIAVVDSAVHAADYTAVLALVTANLLSGSAAIFNKTLIDANGATNSTMIFTAMTALISLLLGVSNTGDLSGLQITQIVLIGICGLTHTYLFHLAIAYSTPAYMSLFYYTSIPFAVVADYVIFNHTLQINSLVGSIIIIGAAAKIANQ